MLDGGIENLISVLKEAGLEKLEYREKWEYLEDFSASCLAWEPSILFKANCAGVDLYKSNLTSDYIATIKMYGVDKTVEEVKDAFEKRLCGDNSPILFDSRHAEITSVTKGEDTYFINVRYYAEEYNRIKTLCTYLAENDNLPIEPEIRQKIKEILPLFSVNPL